MNFRNSVVFSSLFVSISLLSSCTSDAKLDDRTKDQLLGRWEIIEATRNGNPTETLDDLFFEFSEEGIMRSNILGASYKATYEIRADAIRQIGDENGMDLEYIIESITDSTLILNTDLRRFKFHFNLKKIHQEE